MTTQHEVQPHRPPLRLVPAPQIDPPYDDDLETAPMTDGSLALAFPPPTRPDAMPLQLVPPALPRPAPTGAGPAELGGFVRGFAQAVAEVLAGARPPAQLADHARLDVLEHLERAAGRLRAPDGSRLRPIVRSVHVCRPRPAVAEVCAVMDTSPRRRAVAFRLEVHRGDWQCTAIQVG